MGREEARVGDMAIVCLVFECLIGSQRMWVVAVLEWRIGSGGCLLGLPRGCLVSVAEGEGYRLELGSSLWALSNMMIV